MLVSESLHAVGVLIEAVKAVEHWSDLELAQRARVRGYDVSRSNLNRIHGSQSCASQALQRLVVLKGISWPRRILGSINDRHLVSVFVGHRSDSCA